MKRVCFAAVLVVFVAGCASTSTTANSDESQSYMLHGAGGGVASGAASKPPRLTVGTSYPDTQLILPWFLNDIINFVNYR